MSYILKTAQQHDVFFMFAGNMSSLQSRLSKFLKPCFWKQYNCLVFKFTSNLRATLTFTLLYLPDLLYLYQHIYGVGPSQFQRDLL